MNESMQNNKNDKICENAIEKMNENQIEKYKFRIILAIQFDFNWNECLELSLIM